jgi:uncharacterized protein (DUF427 family)
MTIAIEPVAGVVVVRAGGAVLGETRNALALHENGRPPVYYIPRSDFVAAFLEPSETVTTCPLKGEARHYHLAVKSGMIRDAAWSYEAPKDGVAAIAGHLAFYPDKVTVERLGGR